jgi:hypothetical protein
MKIACTSPTLVLLIALAAPVEAAQWVATWGAAPLPPTPAMGPFPATPSFSNQTIRQVVRVSAGGDRVRVRLTNEYGTQPLTIGAARIALASADGTIDPATARPLTFAGQPRAVIPVGAPLLSDAVDLAVRPLASLSISLYLPEDTGACTCHATGLQTAWVSESGNFVDKAFAAKQTLEVRAFLSGVEVQTATPAAAIAVLGDSISDGVGSTTNANRRWPDHLAERARSRGLTVIGATIVPYQGAMYYSERGEAVRQAINDWIRTGKAFDAVLDFDAAIRDPANPARIAQPWHNGDYLHGSDAGYRVLAESIDLSVFR